MYNFGVREVANSKATAAPGWAYVPDFGAKSSVSASQPSSARRARNLPTASAHEKTAKQDAKILRELAALDRENHKDVSIPVPVRHRDNAGRVSHGKVTPAVRKILQSQKTFANHLSDFEALSALNPTSQSVPTQPATPAARAGPSQSTSSAARSGRRKDSTAAPSSTDRRNSKRKESVTGTPLRTISSASSLPTPTIKPEPNTAHDVPMTDAPIFTLSPGNSAPPPPHPGDIDPILSSRVPEVPTDAELQALLEKPPLSYNEARGPWMDDDRRRPVRAFCEVCGYFGRVRCTRCGGRVCALECLGTHREECFTRYGA